MKRITVIVIALTSVLLIRCKKEYACECFNPGGVFKTYTIKDTKKKAIAKCDDYSAEYQDVPFSETMCVVR
jgi:hypothetical protein